MDAGVHVEEARETGAAAVPRTFLRRGYRTVKWVPIEGVTSAMDGGVIMSQGGYVTEAIR